MAKSLTLYELTDTYAAAQDLLAAGDLDPAQEAELEKCLTGILDRLLPEKVEGYCRIVRNLEAAEEALKVEAERLTLRKRALANRAAGLKERLRLALVAVGREKIDAGTFTVGRQASPPAVAIAEGVALPDEFLIPQAPTVDKRALLAALKEGRKVDGCEITRGESLRIR